MNYSELIFLCTITQWSPHCFRTGLIQTFAFCWVCRIRKSEPKPPPFLLDCTCFASLTCQGCLCQSSILYTAHEDFIKLVLCRLFSNPTNFWNASQNQLHDQTSLCLLYSISAQLEGVVWRYFYTHVKGLLESLSLYWDECAVHFHRS